MTINDDEIIYYAVDDRFIFHKLEGGLNQFANGLLFTPNIVEPTSMFYSSISEKFIKLRCIIAYSCEISHNQESRERLKKYGSGGWSHYNCTFVDSKGSSIVAEFNGLTFDSSGFQEYFPGSAGKNMKFTIYDNNGDYKKIIKRDDNPIKWAKAALWVTQIASTIEEFEKGLLIYELLCLIYGYTSKIDEARPRVGTCNKEKLFSVAEDYEKHLNSIKEYNRLGMQIKNEINPNFW